MVGISKHSSVPVRNKLWIFFKLVLTRRSLHILMCKVGLSIQTTSTVCNSCLRVLAIDSRLLANRHSLSAIPCMRIYVMSTASRNTTS